MAGMSNVMEGAVLSILFVVLLGVVVGYFNSVYHQDYSTGLDTSSMNAFSAQVQTGYEQTGGEATQGADGLSLSTSWALAKGLFGTTWNFISGAWIPNIIINMLKMDGVAGLTIAAVLRLLFLAILLFSIIKLFFKVAV